MPRPALQTSLICFLITLIIHALPGQTGKAYEKRAAETYAIGDYASALPCYRVLLDADSLRLDLCYRAGTSAIHLRVFKLAEHYLGRIPDNHKTGEMADTDFLRGLTYKGMARYDDAADAFLRYIEANPAGDKRLLERANAEVESCQWAKTAIKNHTPTRIQRLPERLNSPEADFAPLRFADRLYFSQAGAIDSLGEPLPGRIVASAKGEEPMDALNFFGQAEPGVHLSNYAITLDQQRMYFSRCRDTPLLGAGKMECEVCQSERNPNTSEWQKPRRLPHFINPEGTNNTQPSTGWDKLLNKEVLYFVSDRPQGKGGKDIWCSLIGENGEPTQPYCLPFNTREDEATPSFHQGSQMLFFSSNGGLNFGGYDIFFTKKADDDSGWAAPKNMGFPVNSSYDDLYYSFHSPGKNAYFASNRPGGECDDPDGNCTCQDLYRAHVRTGLEVRVFSEVDSAALLGAKLELTDLTTGQVDSFYVNPKDNRFMFPLELERQYRIRATCPRYMSATTEISTEGVTSFDFIKQNLYLTPGAVLAVRTFNPIDGAPLGGAKIELTDAKTGQVRSLENGQYFSRCDFRIDFDRRYDILVTLKDYASASASVSTEGMVEGDTIVKDLFLSPFQGLPLTLFFDNGQPRFISPEDTTTQLTYGETVQAFFERKPVFAKGFSTGLKGKKQKQEAVDMIEAFFADSVLANFERLNSFCPLLERYLADSNFHHNIEVLFAGFASPLGDSISNQRLTARRVSSLINQFKIWNGGALMPYLDSGQLQINLDPRGEEHDPAVSDDPANRRSAEFSPKASRMRRVVITKIRTLTTNKGEPYGGVFD